jgi:hypothetical protein
MPPGSAYCPGCGRAAPGTWVIESTGDEGSRDREVVIGGRRRHRSPLALAAVAAVLLAGVVLVSRDHSGSSSPATTAAPTTTAPRTTSTTAGTTTSTSELVQRLTPGPVLGEPLGLVVYLAAPRGDIEILYALDVDQGVFREISTMSPTEGELPILGDAVVVGTETSQVLVHPEGATKQLGDPASAVFGAGRPDAYWKVITTDDLNPSTAILVVIGAPEQRSVSILPGFGVFAGDGVGGLLLTGPDDRIYRLAPDSESPVVLDISNVLAAANGRVAAVACDENLRCPIEIIELADGNRHTIRGSNRSDGAASLAPDGAHLAQIVDTPGTQRQALLVFDTTTGDTLLHVPYDGLTYQSGPPKWSPDGRWLFWNDVRGLEAWNIDRIQPQTIDVPGTDGVSMHVVGVATEP